LLDTIEAMTGCGRVSTARPRQCRRLWRAPAARPEGGARALGFRDLDHNVAGVQNARGKLEAAVLHWCTELGHEMAKLSSDVILFSAEEFGWLRLPADLATGSSIMPQKRNPTCSS
jgi:argininosuccinate lyase